MEANFNHLINQPLVINKIFEYLDEISQAKFSRANKKLNSMYKNDRIWRKKIKTFPFGVLLLDDLDNKVWRGKIYDNVQKFMKKDESDDESFIDFHVLLQLEPKERENILIRMKQVLPIYEEDNLLCCKAIKDEKIFKIIFHMSRIEFERNTRKHYRHK